MVALPSNHANRNKKLRLHKTRALCEMLSQNRKGKIMETIIKFAFMVIGFSFIWYQVFKIQYNLARIANALESGKYMDVTINKLTLKQEAKDSDNTTHNNGSVQGEAPSTHS